jgi:hypothetical protein
VPFLLQHDFPLQVGESKLLLFLPLLPPGGRLAGLLEEDLFLVVDPRIFCLEAGQCLKEILFNFLRQFCKKVNILKVKWRDNVISIVK